MLLNTHYVSSSLPFPQDTTNTTPFHRSATHKQVGIECQDYMARVFVCV